MDKEFRNMKKQSLIKMMLAVLISITGAKAYAYDFKVDGIYYQKGNDNTVSVTFGYQKYSGNVVIPSQVTYYGTTYTATAISSEAFDGCSGLTSITIPNSVETIGNWAFLNCSSLTYILIPESLFLVGDEAFYGCSNLNAVYISNLEAFLNIDFVVDNEPNSNPLYYGAHLFLNGNEITELVIPNSITAIRKNTFSNWNSLKSVTIPNNVTDIGAYAFEGCKGLNTIVSEIKEPYSINAFSNETSANAQLLVPKGTKAKYQATEGWNKFTNIFEIGGEGCKFEVDGIKYTVSNDNTVSVSSIDTHTKGNVVIPSLVTYLGTTFNVTSIEKYAFNGHSELTSVTIPNSVISIGEGAFYFCSGLTSVTIPNSVKSIGTYAFYFCMGLTSVAINPKSDISIESDAFSYCFSLKDVYCYAESVPITNSSAFNGIPIESATLYVPTNASEAYRNTQPWSDFETIYEMSKDRSTIHVEIAGTLSNYISSVEKKYINELTITGKLNGTDFAFIRNMAGAPVNYLNYSFIFTDLEADYGNLSVLDISDALIVSGGDYYYKVWYPSDDEYRLIDSYSTSDNVISERMFSSCKLTRLTLPKNIVLIKSDAIGGCENLVEIEIPQSVASIENTFSGCSSLTSIKVESENKNYDSRNNCNAIIETSSNTLIAGCMNTFIPNDVTSIGNYAFWYCSGLTSLTIPNSVISIGNHAFEGCNHLTDFYCKTESIPTIGDYSLEFNKSNTTLYVPATSIQAYRSTSPWNEFKEIIPLEEPGDANGDGVADNKDLDLVVNSIMEGKNDTKTDINKDGKTDVADVVELVNIIKNK